MILLISKIHLYIVNPSTFFLDWYKHVAHITYAQHEANSTLWHQQGPKDFQNKASQIACMR